MKFKCNKCSTGYRVDDSKIPSHDFRIKCKKCDNLITVKHPSIARPEERKPIICPKCNHKQVESESCENCGVIFSKIIKKTKPQAVHKALVPRKEDSRNTLPAVKENTATAKPSGINDKNHANSDCIEKKELSVVHSMKGVQDLLEVLEDRITITPKGVLGFLNKGMKGKKEIPYSSIIAVQFKEAGAFFNGFLQFTIPGGNESKGGIFAATQDENTFMFTGTDNNLLAKQIKDHIDIAVRRVREPQPVASTTSIADELQKLGKLMGEGLLSQEEFQIAKQKLIGEI